MLKTIFLFQGYKIQNHEKTTIGLPQPASRPTAPPGRPEAVQRAPSTTNMANEDLLSPGHVVKERWKVVSYTSHNETWSNAVFTEPPLNVIFEQIFYVI